MDRYWYVRQLGEHDEALRIFDWYKQQTHPSLLFRNNFMGDWLVASYATDDEHTRASHEIKAISYVDGYVGEERLLECFVYHLLLDAANISSRK
jgi:hypothetical protein